MPKRPLRQKKADRLLQPDAGSDAIRCDYALAPLDRLARDMDTRWGIDRLPELVSVAMAEKYGAAMAHLNACIEAANIGQTIAAVENCIKGLNAMDGEATATGHQHANPEIWEMQIDGVSVGLIRDTANWQAAKAKRPDLQIITPVEIEIALTHHANPAVQEVKKTFAGAAVTAIRNLAPVDYANGGDQIPF